MSFLDQLRSLVEDPAPVYAFEISPNGVALGVRSSRRGAAPEIRFQHLDAGVLAVSPVNDNVLLPDVFERLVASMAPMNGSRRQREAALILPDYCTRIAVLDFESFPTEKSEQLSLVRFRMKKTVPFDMDAATLSYHVRQAGKKYEVIVAAAPVEVIARYEAPFRAAGFTPGFATTSIMAAMDLLPAAGLHVAVKLAAPTLTVAVCDGRQPKLVRCVQLETLALDECMAVLFPTLAYAEDEMPRKPQAIHACGFGNELDAFRARCDAELALPVEPLRSVWGAPTEANAGLLGWLQVQEGRA